MATRPSKDTYYLNIALAVAKRSTCLRRKVGAIIVKEDTIISTGYNGPPRGTINCNEVGCLKDEVGAPHGRAWEYCPAVHAEENSVINAARHGASVLNGTMYIAGEYLVNSALEPAEPCQRCRRLIINSGLKRVIILLQDGTVKEFNVSDWIEEERRKYLEELRVARERRI